MSPDVTSALLHETERVRYRRVVRIVSATIFCMLVATFIVACTQHLPCRDGTIFVEIETHAASGSDQLRIDVRVGSQILRGMHAYAGQPSTSVEVDFPNGYPVGQSVSVTITALDGPSEVAQGTAVAIMNASCSHLSIALSPLPSDSDLGDTGGGDLGDIGASVCNLAPDDCPAGSYCNGTFCVAGCKSDAECYDDAGIGKCDATTHVCASGCTSDNQCGGAPGVACCNNRCVNTLSDSQNCNGCGIVCSNTQASTVTCSAGVCGWTCASGYAHCSAANSGCETNLAASMKKTCGGSCVPSTSCCDNSECATPPAPTSCYNAAGSCSGVGGSCTYSLKAGSKVCGSTCCNAINGTCSSSCSLTCVAGFFNCDGDPSNGCESAGPSSGQGCCTGNSPSTSGTPMISHDNGFGGTYWDCHPRGTPGDSSTYNSQMAFDAASSYSAQSGTATTATCGSVSSVCKTSDPSGTSGSCTCWAFTGATAGRAKSSNTGCKCIQSTDPTWN
jgi:hypothetical protein